MEDATQRTKHGFALAQRPPRALGFAAQLYCLLCSCSSCPLQWPTGRGELCGYWLELSTSAATRWVESVPVITHARTVPDADASPILAIVRPSAFVFSESIAAEVALLGEIAIRPHAVVFCLTACPLTTRSGRRETRCVRAVCLPFAPLYCEGPASSAGPAGSARLAWGRPHAPVCGSFRARRGRESQATCFS